ncbi:MAG: hypothetical protein FWE42_08045 [Defluviitaleaceae bacterium]|nr:hypothetical protein [Defluviitaleaceae bacterium]
MRDYNQLLMQAIRYQSPPEIPVSCHCLPSAWQAHGQDLIAVAKEYPDFLPHIPDLDNLEAGMPPTYKYGQHTDEWGCVWSNSQVGMESIVTGHPIKTREDIINMKIPPNRDGRLPHGFMYLRLLDLRGFEEAMIDFAEECDELQILIDKVEEYNRHQVAAILPDVKEGGLVHFGDDLGIQHGLAIGAEKWRKYLKPAFTRIYAPIKKKGALIHMHTDGRVIDIMEDIVECGVDMINPQFRANGLDDLVKVCKGKIPINLDLDRQLFPVATPSQIDDHVRECVEALYMPEGGLALMVEVGHDIPLGNIVAIFDAVRKYRVHGN